MINKRLNLYLKNEYLEMKEKFGNTDIEKALDEAEEQLNNPSTKYLKHEEVFSKARRILDGKN